MPRISRVSFNWDESTANITSFNHVGRFHDPRICQMYFMRAPNKVRVSIYYSYIQADTWKFGWSNTPNAFHMTHYSSRYYSLGVPFITTLITENTNIVHNILTIHVDTIHSSCHRCFLIILKVLSPCK